ncbi:MAG: ABC transporter substrate-binding protein [Bacillota bacterium]
MRKFIALVLVVLVSIGVMIGCNTTAPKGNSGTPTGAPTESEKVTYPLSLKDAFGKVVDLKTEPARIVSLSPTTTEIVFALGAGAKLVGRTDYCDFPATAKTVPSVGEVVNPNVETIVSMKPDVIFASSMTKADIISKLRQLKFVVYMEDDLKGIEGAYQSINDLGQILNAKGTSDQVVTSMKNHLLYIKGKLRNLKTRPSVYYVVGFGQYGDWTPGKGTFIDEAINLAGGTNSGAAAVNWKFSLEQLIKNNPKIILCQVNPDLKSSFVKADKYKDLPAVKAGKVYSIDNNKLDRAGPRIIDGIDELSRLIQPSLRY